MNPAIVATVVLASLLAAVLLGTRIAGLLPEHHLSSDTRDTVKLATGLIATMAALLLGLLVTSAKSGHDSRRNQVIQMAAKVSFLDRILAGYGPEATDARAKVRVAVEEMVQQIWPHDGKPAPLASPGPHAGVAAYLAIESLPPREDMQGLKNRAATLAIELGELRSLLLAQSIPSISLPMLIVMVCWLVVIFLSFSLLAPRNVTALLALIVSALSVSGAIFLVLELDQPFGGTIQVSGQPILDALSQLGK